MACCSVDLSSLSPELQAGPSATSREEKDESCSKAIALLGKLKVNFGENYLIHGLHWLVEIGQPPIVVALCHYVDVPSFTSIR